jgi:K+/H+ antiporter YhaU regulatory subunit KhtT
MSKQNRVRKLINLDIKKEIISKRESGKRVGDLTVSAEYGAAKSTISTILKNKE